MAVESMIRRRVAPDNSCLFSAVGYLCQGKQGSSLVRELRAAVAEHVKQDPEAGEASLGMDKEAYCEWIQKFSSWG
ncbi:hypothetical protein T484DRAFT_1815791 [Baffinella frigidus]|nr:hypothetical protein T484DRAFT_1815791 [Cryptophyta sp. CCMP2293]